MTKAPLDHTQPQQVQYCVPLWLRNEQIAQNLTRIQGRVQPQPRRDEPVAIACFGPSLRETWAQLRDYPFVISCSGAHKFLVERGLIPTWHVEVDPRAHKVDLIGPPQAATEYLIASTCHPKVLDHLQDSRVKLWHVFDNSEDGQRLLPADEWAITGGCDVGLRALTIAAFLGFRDLHVFGMDQSAGTVDRPEATRHAADHPHTGSASKYSTCEFDGVTYYTTVAMLEAARNVAHELDQMPVVHATFHGDGLCQHMMRAYVRKPLPEAQQRSFENTIAFSRPATISAEYAVLNAQLHRENLAYGVGGGKHAKVVTDLVTSLKTTSVLDYGCGKGYLAKALPFPIWEYDPAIPDKSQTPRPADIVVCTDVLEHIEPDRLQFALNDLARCVRKVGYFVIHTGPAAKTLADGRNTHLLQHGEPWWRKKLERFFTVGNIDTVGPELHIVVGPKKKGTLNG